MFHQLPDRPQIKYPTERGFLSPKITVLLILATIMLVLSLAEMKNSAISGTFHLVKNLVVSEALAK